MQLAPAPLIDSWIAVERERIDSGDLPDDRLVDLLRAVEHGTIRHPGIHCPATYLALGPAQRAEVKALAARAVAARGGTFRAPGFEWVAVGSTIKTRMPTGGAP